MNKQTTNSEQPDFPATTKVTVEGMYRAGYNDAVKACLEALPSPFNYTSSSAKHIIQDTRTSLERLLK